MSLVAICRLLNIQKFAEFMSFLDYRSANYLASNRVVLLQEQAPSPKSTLDDTSEPETCCLESISNLHDLLAPRIHE